MHKYAIYTKINAKSPPVNSVYAISNIKTVVVVSYVSIK